MKYVDAGYAIGLGVLFLYAVWLVLRRRRLEAAVARQAPAPADPGGHAPVAPGAAVPGPTVVATDEPASGPGPAGRTPVVEVTGDGHP